MNNTLSGMTPERLLRIQHNDLKDALDALYDPLPVNPGEWTDEAVSALMRRLYIAEARTRQIRETLNAKRVYGSSCDGTAALRGMVNDMGEAGYEWPWES